MEGRRLSERELLRSPSELMIREDSVDSIGAKSVSEKSTVEDSETDTVEEQLRGYLLQLGETEDSVTTEEETRGVATSASQRTPTREPTMSRDQSRPRTTTNYNMGLLMETTHDIPQPPALVTNMPSPTLDSSTVLFRGSGVQENERNPAVSPRSHFMTSSTTITPTAKVTTTGLTSILSRSGRSGTPAAEMFAIDYAPHTPRTGPTSQSEPRTNLSSNLETIRRDNRGLEERLMNMQTDNSNYLKQEAIRLEQAKRHSPLHVSTQVLTKMAIILAALSICAVVLCICAFTAPF